MKAKQFFTKKLKERKADAQRNMPEL